MDTKSDSCADIVQRYGKSSIIPTVDCRPYNAKLSEKVCALKYAKATANNKRISEKTLRHVKCRNCETGRGLAEKYTRAKNYKRWKVDNETASCIYQDTRLCLNQYKVWERLGYTREEYQRHMENQFKPGMSWDNYGEWETDHIIPKSAFYYESTDDAQFKQCWALSNLRPLWREDNQVKGRKIEGPL